MAGRLRKELRKFLRTRYGFAILPVVLMAAYALGGVPALLAASVVGPLLLATSVGAQITTVATLDAKAWPELAGRDDLVEWVERALVRFAKTERQVAVIFVSIDDLDTIEDRFGRAMHDSVMEEAVIRLTALLREDDVIARVGSAIAIGLSKIRVPENESLMLLAQRLQQTFETPFSKGQTRTYCSISLGIAAESHFKSSSGASIVAGAQRASELTLVSSPGAIRFYSGDLSSEEAMNRNTARELNTALDTGEIFAWFQPQVSTEDGKVVGFEALARWEHPERGLISPASFLPDIERCGLSQRLTEVILTQSLMAINLWDAAGYDVPSVSVNFAAEELKNPRLPDYVRWELDRHGIKPDRLVVEVLESVASESSEDVITRTLHALSRIGCRIDLDDFGTGYTSFVNIRRFDVERIKVDRSLVNQLDTDKDQLRMFSALLAFGEKLGIETLAEGVETQGEADTLRSLGCPSMQGYVISRPLPLGETVLWLEERGDFAVVEDGGTLLHTA
ncbi:MAG: GGDEF domain-containing phosphodiesterase [Pseudomonadota bacterium]